MIFYSVYLCYFLGVNDEVVFWGGLYGTGFHVDVLDLADCTPNYKLHNPSDPNMYRIIKHDILFSISLLFYSVNDEVEPVERPQVFWGLYGAGFHVGWAGFGRLSRGDHSYIT